jgi:Na+/proline symporter
MLWVFYQQNPMAIPIPESRPGLKSNDFIYPIFMMTGVPHVLKGFLIVAILSAAMSSISSALTSLASVSTMDFVKALYGGRSEEFYLRFSKYSTVAWAAALIGVAYLTRQVDFVLNAAFSLRGLTSGALLGGLLLAVFGRKGGPMPVIVGMLASLAVMIGVSQLEWTQFVDGKEIKAKVFWPWFTLIGTVVTLSVAWLTRLVLGERQTVAEKSL